jgi:hypothetical protein
MLGTIGLEDPSITLKLEDDSCHLSSSRDFILSICSIKKKSPIPSTFEQFALGQKIFALLFMHVQTWTCKLPIPRRQVVTIAPLFAISLEVQSLETCG